MQEMYNLTFVYLKNFVLLYFWILDSGFRIPDFRVALHTTLAIGKYLMYGNITSYKKKL